MWKYVPSFCLCSLLFVLLFLLLLRLRKNILHQHFVIISSNGSSISTSISTIILRVFENRVLRRIFWPKRDKVTREWRKLHSEELNDLYSSHKIVRVIKSRRKRRAGLVALTREKRDLWVLYAVFRWGNLKERIHLVDPSVEGRILLRWIFRKWMWAWTGLIWLRIGTGGGHLRMG